MTNLNVQWYAVRQTTKFLLPHELAEVVSIWNNYSDASNDCENRFINGSKGVHVTTYDHVSESPIN